MANLPWVVGYANDRARGASRMVKMPYVPWVVGKRVTERGGGGKGNKNPSNGQHNFDECFKRFMQLINHGNARSKLGPPRPTALPAYKPTGLPGLPGLPRHFPSIRVEKAVISKLCHL